MSNKKASLVKSRNNVNVRIMDVVLEGKGNYQNFLEKGSK